eukprot:scaffold11938_cov54-Phaeocystis_antarctica.AAC.1
MLNAALGGWLSPHTASGEEPPTPLCCSSWVAGYHPIRRVHPIRLVVRSGTRPRSYAAQLCPRSYAAQPGPWVADYVPTLLSPDLGWLVITHADVACVITSHPRSGLSSVGNPRDDPDGTGWLPRTRLAGTTALLRLITTALDPTTALAGSATAAQVADDHACGWLITTALLPAH